jgi:putative PEP-CTERM system TPR-repeat lipoprotein
MSEVLPSPLPIVFAASALLALGGCNYFASDQSRINKAAQLRTQGDYRAAAIELKKVLQHDADNREARFQLGQVSLLTGEAAAAEKELRHALDLGVPKDQVIVALGRALLDQGHAERALRELDAGAVGDEEARTGVLTLRGEAYLALGKLDDAEGALRSALALRAASLDARLGLAEVEEAKGNRQAAQADIADALSKNPGHRRAWLAQGRLELRGDQYARAEQSFARALELAPVPVLDEFLARNGLAESQWRQGNSDSALKHVERLLALAPQHPRPKFLRAVIAYGAGDYKTAKEYLQQVLRGHPDDAAAALLLGATHYADGELEQADMYLSNVLAADPSSTGARKLLAATRLRQQKPQEAIAALAPALTADGNDGQLLALMGNASLQAGDADAGIRYLQRSAETDPSNPALQMQLAAGYVSAGDAEHAIGLLEKMPETQGGAYGRELLLILAHLRKGDYDGALAQARKVVASRPNDPGAYNLAGNVYVAVGQLSGAREQFEKALQLKPDNPAALMNLGRLDLREGKQDNARARFERVLALSANNLNAMLALAQLSALRNDQAGVTQWLERASAANPQAIDPQLLLIRHYLETGDRARARSLATDLAKAMPGDANVHNALGIVQIADGNQEEAVASFRKAAAAAPRSADFACNLARAELLRQHRDEAKKLLEKALELQPDHLAATSTLATLEMQQGDAQQALARARALQQHKETAAAGHMLEGDLLMMQRKFDSAARAYAATSTQAQTGLVAIKSYRALRQTQAADAAKPLEEWLSKHPDDARVRLALAQAYQGRGQLKQAAAEYEMVLKKHPDHAATLNNLAWTYHEMRDPRAMETAERAHKLVPDNGAITDTLGWLLVEQGQAQRGVELLRLAAKQAPEVPDIRYHLAVALTKTGANEEARSTLAELVRSGQSFSDLAKAKQLLQQL